MLEKHAEVSQLITRTPLGMGCKQGAKKLGEEVDIASHNKVKHYLQFMCGPC